MTILFLALWLQMSAQPQIKFSCLEEFGCHERWGDAVQFFEWIQTTDPASTAILPWTSAETPTDTPWENCVVSDAAGNDKPCGAADETDVKPPKTITTVCFDCKPYIPAAPTITPERVDVPPVHQCTTKVPGWMVCPEYRLTCADKSRVLLTSEDGKKHCIKF